MFDPATFVEECRQALGARDVRASLADVVGRAVGDRAALLAALPLSDHLQVTVLHSEPSLTVAQLVSPPGFAFPPHDHRMVSVVGVYSGMEQNVYYHRKGCGLLEVRRQLIRPGEVVAHELDVIHGISTGSDEPLAAIHVYSGDFFRQERSEWSGEPVQERPYDPGRLRQLIDV